MGQRVRRSGSSLQAERVRVGPNDHRLRVDRGQLVAEIAKAVMQQSPRGRGLPGTGIRGEQDGPAAPLEDRRVKEEKVAATSLQLEDDVLFQLEQQVVEVVRFAVGAAVATQDKGRGIGCVIGRVLDPVLEVGSAGPIRRGHGTERRLQQLPDVVAGARDLHMAAQDQEGQQESGPMLQFAARDSGRGGGWRSGPDRDRRRSIGANPRPVRPGHPLHQRSISSIPSTARRARRLSALFRIFTLGFRLGRTRLGHAIQPKVSGWPARGKLISGRTRGANSSRGWMAYCPFGHSAVKLRRPRLCVAADAWVGGRAPPTGNERRVNVSTSSGGMVNPPGRSRPAAAGLPGEVGGNAGDPPPKWCRGRSDSREEERGGAFAVRHWDIRGQHRKMRYMPATPGGRPRKRSTAGYCRSHPVRAYLYASSAVAPDGQSR